ncbi:MAG: TetR/AcrR family transcriptional regulator [Chloroflexota bacterium]
MDRKTEIIQLTIEMLKVKGFDSFSYNDLSQEIGISKASIHHHFKRKEDLGLALLVFMKEGVLRRNEHLYEIELSPWEKLEAFFNMNARVIENGTKSCPVNSLQANVNVISAEMADVLKEIVDLEIDLVTIILEEGRKEGQLFFKGKARDHAALVVSTTRGAMQQSRIHGHEFFRQTIEQMKTNLKV